jgi:hypothetical protein
MDGQCNDGGRAGTMSKLILALTTGWGESTVTPSKSIARLSAKGSGGYGQASLRKKRIAVWKACVTIVPCKIPADFRAHFDHDRAETVVFCLANQTPP